MKNFIIPVLSLCFIVSCSADDPAKMNEVSNYERPGFTQKNLSVVYNNNNPYDYVGEFHAEILEEYLLEYDSVATLDGIVTNVNQIADDNDDFADMVLQANSYSGVTFAQLKWLVTNSMVPQDIINASALSAYGKGVAGNFASLLNDFEFKSYTSVIADIKNFETLVQNDQELTAGEKETLLVVTSVARFSMEAEYPRKRSWSTTKSGIIATVVATGPLEAVTLSVAVTIGAE